MVTELHVAICSADGFPPPPAEAEEIKPGVFDWRHPGSFEVATIGTPISFRWRFDDGRLVNFAAYGWHRRKVGYGRTIKEPEYGYSLLPPVMRDQAAREIFGTWDHTFGMDGPDD